MENNSLQKEINSILESSKDEIKEAVNNQIKEALKKNISWNLEQEIKTAVADFFKNEMEGEIKTALLDCKDEILLQLRNGIVASCAQLAKEMAMKAEANLKSSWNFDEITKKLFK